MINLVINVFIKDFNFNYQYSNLDYMCRFLMILKIWYKLSN